MDPIMHFEIRVDDVKRASSFYKNAFGWTAEEFGGIGYWRLSTTDADERGTPKSSGDIKGGMAKRNGLLKNNVLIIGVKDIDASLAMVEKLGGKTVQKKQAVADIGFTACLKDTEDNIIGLWEAAGQMSG
jgi:predicted enzyme related to lactoylglutathione lyase